MGSLHDKAAWHRRARRQLQYEPLCAMCLSEGRIVAARIADHVEPHHNVRTSGSPSSIPTVRAPTKALRMQVTEKPRKSQMSPLSLMFAALLLMVIVGTSALKISLVLLTTFLSGCVSKSESRKLIR